MTFIVIDGTDGSGKATQTGLLKKKLEEAGKKVSVFDFPRYGNPSARLIEEYLNGEFGSADEVNPKAASILYAIDRFAAKKDMQQAEGIIICNRYVSANQGHQAGKIADPKKRKEFLDWLDDLEYGIFGIPRPDLNIFLDVPPEIGQTLVDKKGKRDYTDGRDIHEQDIDHLRNAYDAYHELCKGSGWTRVECVEDGRLLDKDSVAKRVWEKVSDLL